jgi:signal transduction histidine kinase
MRGLIGVAVLSPLLYGYFLMRSSNPLEPTIYLRVFFPFVIALFYGYFAQVERLQARLKKQTEWADRTARFREEAGSLGAEKDRLVRELQQTRQLLERASLVKEEFLGVMSHELRTPLNVVMGYARLLNERILGEMNPMQAEAVSKIMSRARDQLNMIADILEIAGIESGDRLTAGYEVSLPCLLDDLKAYYEIPERKEVVLSWNYPADLPIIRTDAEKLKHALQNLINNALKFTHSGVVTITVRVQEGDREKDVGEALSPQAFVEFIVTDPGIGIPEDQLSHIFDSFRQIDSSDTRCYGGVGMGLYVVKKLTEILGAHVQVKSAPGRGSTFTLLLPYDEKPKPFRLNPAGGI